MPFLEESKFSLAALRKWHAEKATQLRDSWWKDHIPKSYKNLEIKEAPSFPKELYLERKALSKIIAARTGHGDFATYHTRFKHEEAKTTCRCGSAKTPTHFLFCRILRRRGGRPSGPIQQLIRYLLGTSEGAFILSKWLESTRFFEEICPR